MGLYRTDGIGDETEQKIARYNDPRTCEGNFHVLFIIYFASGIRCNVFRSLLWRNSRLLSMITCLAQSNAIFFSVPWRRDRSQRSLNWANKMLHCNFDTSFILLAKRMNASIRRTSTHSHMVSKYLVVYQEICFMNVIKRWIIVS
jgi:hypothetical protein